jgi:hypothetical protein
MLQQQYLSACLYGVLCASYAELPHKECPMDAPERQIQTWTEEECRKGQVHSTTAVLQASTWQRLLFTCSPFDCAVAGVTFPLCGRRWLARLGFHSIATVGVENKQSSTSSDEDGHAVGQTGDDIILTEQAHWT